jgi:TolA-binding protein
MKRHEPTDLICCATRAPLGDADERLLGELVATSVDARVMFEAQAALDEDSAAQRDDSALLERMSARATAAHVRDKHRHHQGTARPLRRVALVTTAALVVAATVAAASPGLRRWVGASPTAAPKPQSTPRRGGTQSQPYRAKSESSGHAIVQPRAESRLARQQQEHKPRLPVVVAPPDLSAADLFRSANDARRSGDTHGAISRYEQLLARHPTAPEAPLSRLASAHLLLRSGRVDRALTVYRQVAASGGSLRSEALWGQADCLRRLGRSAEERSALLQIVKEHPTSAHAAGARGRLARP